MFPWPTLCVCQRIGPRGQPVNVVVGVCRGVAARVARGFSHPGMRRQDEFRDGKTADFAMESNSLYFHDTETVTELFTLGPAMQ